METNQIDYQQLADALISRAGAANGGSTRTKAVSTTPSALYAQGPGGLFSGAGLSRELFSAMVLPIRGLQSRLPVRASQDVNPLYGIITGVTATSGSEPNGVCDDPPTVGVMKLCTHSFLFGRFSRQTPVYDIDMAGRRTNRGEFTDFEIYGGPSGEESNVPTLPGAANLRGAVRSEVGKMLFELATAWARDFAQVVYEGNPTNNTAGGGTQYFYGLNSLINTGYRDAITGQACPAADSIVASFGNNNVATSGAAIVNAITDTYHRLRYIGETTGLSPVRWVIAMPYTLFYELTKVWPCAYMTSGCSVPTGASLSVDSGDQIVLRDRMRGDLRNRTGQYLLIDGEEVEVVLDDAIDQDGTGAGTYQSQIYFVPLTVLGNRPVTYMEYYKYDVDGGAIDLGNMLAPAGTYMASDNGRFLWAKKMPSNFCVQWMAKTQPRLLLLTPFLAARLTNVRFTPLNMVRSWDPSSPYFVDGGRTNYTGYGPSYYSPTA